MASANPPRLPVDEPTAEAVSRAFRLDGFFPEFTAEHCAKLFPRSGLVQFRPGERLVEQGESGRDLFLLLAGEAAVVVAVDSMRAEAARLGDGAVVGEMALLADGVRGATVEAVTRVFAYRLAHEDLGYVLAHNAGLAAHLRALAAERASR